MSATFNGDSRTEIISCDSPTNASDKSDITIFYNELSSLAQHVLIIGGDMHAKQEKMKTINFAYTVCQTEMANIK